jgi:hypothetical protein
MIEDLTPPGGPDTTAQAPVEQSEGIERNAPEIDPATSNLIKRWTKTIQQAVKFYEKPFERMRQDMEYATFGCDKKHWDPDIQYTANIVQRHIGQSVATLYARNPRAQARRRDKLDYRIWDGDPRTIQAALQTAPMGDPQAMAVLTELEQVKTQRRMIDNLGRTLELLFGYYTGEQEPNFKVQLKQAVRRAKICGVAYLELGFQRLMQKNPDISQKINDVTEQLNAIQAIAEDLADSEIEQDSPEVAELRIMLEELQKQEQIIAREGPTFSFPRATEIIVDPRCKHLKGFINARWVAVQILMSPEEIEESYGVDIGTTYTVHNPDNRDYLIDQDSRGEDVSAKKSLARVWRVYDKKTGTVFTIAEGYSNYLKAPEKPTVEIERFFPVFALSFNDVESEKELYPMSDVQLMRPMQDEYNRSRQGLREHRIANRPKYGVAKGRLEKEDKNKLESHPANAIIELASLQTGEKVGDILQPIMGPPIQKELYDVEMVFQDTLRVVGSQEANLGPTTNATATESSIAENSRTKADSSNVDDLDEFLGDVARATGQLMLMELSLPTVQEIAGVGAVWPQWSQLEIIKDVSLEIKAGSSGRPNTAMKLANLERAMPVIMQMPGVNPSPFLKEYLDLLDIDVDEAVLEAMPSMMALNAMMAKMAAVPAAHAGQPNAPQSQGPAGAANAPRGPQPTPGPQPKFPTPAPVGNSA